MSEERAVYRVTQAKAKPASVPDLRVLSLAELRGLLVDALQAFTRDEISTEEMERITRDHARINREIRKRLAVAKVAGRIT